MIAQVIPPDAAALWKQMKSLGYAARDGVGGEGRQSSASRRQSVRWPRARRCSGTGPPNNGNVGGQALYDATKAKFGEGQATHGFIASYAMVQILADAISRAGSTEPDAINEALARPRTCPPCSRRSPSAVTTAR